MVHLISDKLRDQTTRFTTEIKTLLNCTIADHVQIKAVALQVGDDRLFMLGHLLDKRTLTAHRFRLRPRAPKVELWMDVSFQLRLDAERPCLEDIIEFLIVERLVLARDGYEKVIETGREGFRKNQLMAAMRRDRATVEAFVERYGTRAKA